MTLSGIAAPPSPHVAIIIVNWNGREVTLECLRSLTAISYRPASIIVVDNGSTDGSAEAIRRDFPDATVLRLEQNLRFAGGNNAGIRLALERGAALVLLLNNDTVVDPAFLPPLVERLAADRRIGAVAPAIYYFDAPDRFWFAGGRVSFWTGATWHTGIREADTGQYAFAREIDYASGCCLLTSREVIEKVGLLDESFFIYGEDADWSMRVRRAGYSIVFEPKAKVRHKVSVTSGGHLSPFKLRNKFISNFRFLARYARWYHWLVFPWMFPLASAFAALKYLFRPR